MFAASQFRHADFAVIRHHVPELKDLTVQDLRKAVERNKDRVAASAYKEPHLQNVLSYLAKGNDDEEVWATEYSSHSTSSDIYMSNGLGDYDIDGTDQEQLKGDDETEGQSSIKLTNELRLSFIDIVRASFERQVEKGELDARQEDGALYFALLQSCDFAADLVIRGHGLQGFEATAVAEVAWIDKMDIAARRILRPRKEEYKRGERGTTASFRALRFDVYRSLAFIEAHRHAQEQFYQELIGGEIQDESLTKRARLVLFESEKQVAMAEDLLRSFDPEDVCILISHLFCAILLNKIARDAERLQTAGILHEKEARRYLEETEEELHNIEFCANHVHPGQHVNQKQDGNGHRSSVSRMLDGMKSISFQKRASQAVMDLESPKKQ